MTGAASPGPLDGVKVLDLSRVLAGPTAAQTLADLGADVIKIERPGGGDDTRMMGPHLPGRDVELVNRSAYFWSVNRGKRSVVIDLADPDGADLVRGLACHVDVLIEKETISGDDFRRLLSEYAVIPKANLDAAAAVPSRAKTAAAAAFETVIDV